MTHERIKTIESMLSALHLRNSPLYLHPAPADGAYIDDSGENDVIDDFTSLKRQIQISRAVVYAFVAFIGLHILARHSGASLWGGIALLTITSYAPIHFSSNLFWWTTSARRLTPYLAHIENIVSSLCLYSDRERLWNPHPGQELSEIKMLLDNRIEELDILLPKHPTRFERLEYWMAMREQKSVIAARNYFFPHLPPRVSTL